MPQSQPWELSAIAPCGSAEVAALAGGPAPVNSLCSLGAEPASKSPAQVTNLLNVGNVPADKSLDQIQLMAMTVAAKGAMNAPEVTHRSREHFG